MSKRLLDYIIRSVETSKRYNSSMVTAPRVILWPDPEQQWMSIVEQLRAEIPAFLTLGEWKPEINQGPAIWMKCMVDRALPEANWDADTIPVIYLPGVSKQDFRNIEEAPQSLQPLMEYQFTGNLWTQENGREWTIMAFIQNPDHGLGLDVARDNATKEALLQGIKSLANDPNVAWKSKVDVDFLNQLMFPQVIPNLINWMEKGDEGITSLDLDQQNVFKNIIKSQYGLALDRTLYLDFVQKLGSQKDAWTTVWQYFANAPHKYPNIIQALRDNPPKELGDGLFGIPTESWPSINEEEEQKLAAELINLTGLTTKKRIGKLKSLSKIHSKRSKWVWAEIGESPLSIALPHIMQLAESTAAAYDESSIDALSNYYTEQGYQIDTAMRQMMLCSDSEAFRKVCLVMVNVFYTPWLTRLTQSFQTLLQSKNSSLDRSNIQASISNSNFILFVDAFRYDVAVEFYEHLSSRYEAELNRSWSAFPSLTATSKPSVSPISDLLNTSSEISEFQPKFKDDTPCSHYYFKKNLDQVQYTFLNSPSDISDPNMKYWMEIGDIDKKGHQDQSKMLAAIPSLIESLKSTIEAIAEKGIGNITIVTDHGWLMLPGGLPKATLHKDLVATRWGRCAELKPGTKSKLLQLPWHWNQSIPIAYAPGISFFKNNEEYAHGGISIQECLTPVMTLKVKSSSISKGKATIEDFKWAGLRLKVTTSGTSESYQLDIRTNKADEKTSVAITIKQKSPDQWTIMADDTAQGVAATIILLDGSGVIVDQKLIEIAR